MDYKAGDIVIAIVNGMMFIGTIPEKNIVTFNGQTRFRLQKVKLLARGRADWIVMDAPIQSLDFPIDEVLIGKPEDGIRRSYIEITTGLTIHNDPNINIRFPKNNL